MIIIIIIIIKIIIIIMMVYEQHPHYMVLRAVNKNIYSHTLLTIKSYLKKHIINVAKFVTSYHSNN